MVMIVGMAHNANGSQEEAIVEVILMRFYSYVIVRDFGFAPNPFFGYCTLATCKPRIRQSAQIGDLIAGFAGANFGAMRHRLVYLMRVDEICSFDEYWYNSRFESKKPSFSDKFARCYGDNIYHHDEHHQWVQANSHHSLENGNTNLVNLRKDTHVNRVLISSHFWYFGQNALLLPEEFQELIACGRNHQIKNMETGLALERWLSNFYSMGQHGLPLDFKPDEGFVRFSGDR